MSPIPKQDCCQKTVEYNLATRHCQRKQVDGYKQEYEALAKMANHRPSRAILEKRLLLAQKQMQVAISTEQSLQQELDIRQAQFNTLMQCMLDLKASVQQENDATTNEKEETNVRTSRKKKRELFRWIRHSAVVAASSLVNEYSSC